MRCKTPSFITEIPLTVTSQDEKELTARFNVGSRLYNACLNEAMVRMNLVRNSDLYKVAKSLPKGKQRTEAFKIARETFRYSEFSLHAYASLIAKRSVWISEKLDSNTIQTLATRAFKASERVIFGRAKKVRYKGAFRFRSLEGKTNKQGIRWFKGQFVWGSLILHPYLEDNDPVILHGLNSPIKYVRIIRKELKGRIRYFAQLINEGIPFMKKKNYIRDGLVGLDLNISNVGVVADDVAEILPLAQKVPAYTKEIKSLQRQMDRSRRTNNPDNYEPDFNAKKGRKVVKKKGKSKKGRRKWSKSKNYIKLASRRRELERRKTAYTKSQNRKLVNKTLRMGNTIKTERVSVKGWQKRYGKAIAAKAPGFFMSELVRKAESAGGQVIKFSTQKTALSQTHLNGERIKKSLSERIHKDTSGFLMHRDLFSAFLARYVVEDTLLLQAAQYEWPRLEQVLMEAWQKFQSVNRVSASESRQSQPPVERISIDLEKANQIGIPYGFVRKVS